MPIEEVFQHTNLAFSKMTIVGIIFGVILFTIGIFARVPLSMHALYLLCVYLVYSTQNMAYAKCAGLLPFLVAYLNIITKESNLRFHFHVNGRIMLKSCIFCFGSEKNFETCS